ncbi:MAG: hypothetical protein Alpg2KO_33100 [Alphaproteobacteria bacterium]
MTKGFRPVLTAAMLTLGAISLCQPSFADDGAVGRQPDPDWSAPALPPPSQLPMPQPMQSDGSAQPRKPIVDDPSPAQPVDPAAVQGLEMPPPDQLAKWVWHEQPRQVPLFEFYGPDGIQYSNLDLRGRPVLINIWATWCLPCIVELPMLDKLAGDPANSGILILPIARERTTFSRVNQMYDRLQIQHLQKAIDPEYSMLGAFDRTALPTTILLNGRGQEVGRVQGLLDWSGDAGATIMEQARQLSR